MTCQNLIGSLLVAIVTKLDALKVLFRNQLLSSLMTEQNLHDKVIVHGPSIAFLGKTLLRRLVVIRK